MSEWKLSGLDHFLFTSLGQQPGLSTCNSLSYGPTRTKAFLTSSPGNIPSAFRSVGTLLWGTLMAREGRWGQPFKSSLIFNIPNDFCFDSDFPQDLKLLWKDHILVLLSEAFWDAELTSFLSLQGYLCQSLSAGLTNGKKIPFQFPVEGKINPLASLGAKISNCRAFLLFPSPSLCLFLLSFSPSNSTRSKTKSGWGLFDYLGRRGYSQTPEILVCNL